MVLSHFLELPPEIITKILSGIDAKSLLVCGMACRRLRALISGSSALQYIIMLRARGLRDGASGHLPAEERLSRLLTHELAWRNARFTKHSTTMLDTSFEVSSNLIVSFYPRSRQRLLIRQVPSYLRGVTAREWEIVLPFKALHFIVDAAQDLLLATEREPQMLPGVVNNEPAVRLHRLHLSTGDHHGLATSRGALELGRYDAITLRNSWDIQGDYVKISINHEPTVTDIWNWKTGTWEAEVSPAGGRVSDDISILDDRHVVGLWSEKPNSLALAVHTFRGDSHKPPRVRIGESPIVALELPLLRRDRRFVDCQLRAGEPTPDWPESASAQEAGLFRTEPTDRLLSMQFGARAKHSGVRPGFEVLVPISVILSRVKKRSTAPLPWNSWGSTNAVFHHIGASAGLALYGSHAVHHMANGIRIVDLHRGRIHRALRGRSEPFPPFGDALMSEAFVGGQIFSTGMLSYTVSKVLEEFQRGSVLGVVLGEDMLVVSENNGTSDQDVVNTYVIES